MTEEEKKIEQNIMPWRFWLFALLSAFLVVTFILYLPMRFQYQGIVHDMGDKGGQIMAGGHMEHGANIYHEESDIREGLAVNLNIAPVPVMIGSSTRLDFFVNNKSGNIPMPVSDLEIEHTKLMHVIGVRDDMNEFFHIHPQPTSTPGILIVDHIFSHPGYYKIWSQVKKDGVVHTVGYPTIDVQGEGNRSHKEVSFGRNMIVGDYQVVLKLDEPAVKGVETSLSFDIHTLTGKEVEVEPYIGADMHLAVIKDDLTQFIHAHPEGHDMDMNEQHGALRVINEAKAHGAEEENVVSGAANKTISFHVVFPESGLYRMYAQFRPKGTNLAPDESLTASFWVRVDVTGPLKVSQFSLVIISLVLMSVLSWVVRKWLIVKD